MARCGTEWKLIFTHEWVGEKVCRLQFKISIIFRLNQQWCETDSAKIIARIRDDWFEGNANDVLLSEARGQQEETAQLEFSRGEIATSVLLLLRVK